MGKWMNKQTNKNRDSTGSEIQFIKFVTTLIYLNTNKKWVLLEHTKTMFFKSLAWGSILKKETDTYLRAKFHFKRLSLAAMIKCG